MAGGIVNGPFDLLPVLSRPPGPDARREAGHSPFATGGVSGHGPFHPQSLLPVNTRATLDETLQLVHRAHRRHRCCGSRVASALCALPGQGRRAGKSPGPPESGQPPAAGAKEGDRCRSNSSEHVGPHHAGSHDRIARRFVDRRGRRGAASMGRLVPQLHGSDLTAGTATRYALLAERQKMVREGAAT